MQLNQVQEAAVSAVFDFLLSSDKEFNVSGPAGVGKTFLMKYIMKNVIREYEEACHLMGATPISFDVHLTATTNKAAEVLQQATGFPAATIHSHMNLKVVDDYKTGATKISRTNAWTVHSKQLIFIDEASMIDSELHKYILAGTDATCKIVYVGDHCQLAPVFETISPVYRNPKHFVVLTEPVRNAGQPALVDLCNQLRDTVETLQFRPIKPVPGVVDYLDDAAAKAFIDSHFDQERVDSRILCYSNNRVQEYNQYIRDLRSYPAQFTAGELVINNSGIQLGQTFLRVEQELLVKNVGSTERIVLDEKDPNAVLDVYNITLSLPNGTGHVAAKIPLDPDHAKALMKYYAGLKQWPTFFKIKNSYPDLRQKDAATVYKAQGSTYETAVLDLSNIGKCNQPDQVARMLYVGASRATTRLLLYGQLPPRYRGAA